MTDKRTTLLCIDDHETFLAGWCLYLQNAGYSVQTTHRKKGWNSSLSARSIWFSWITHRHEVAATMKRISPLFAS